MIGVTAASGQLGRKVIAALEAAGAGGRTVALLRDPAKMAGAAVALRQADYDQPEDLAEAFAGIETLLLISGSTPGARQKQHADVIAAARAAGVRRIVYTSLLRADSSALALAEDHLVTEAALKASGLEVTLLRNGWYTENYLGRIVPALETGQLSGALGAARINSASRDDYAAAAAAVLTGAGHEGRTYELAGDEGWTMTDFAAAISAASGRSVAYEDLENGVYEEVLKSGGLPAPVAAFVAGLEAAAAGGALASDDRSLSRLIGRPTTPMAEVVARAVRAQS